MAERIVIRDEEPGVAASLHHLLCGSDRQRVGVEYPLNRVGAAELAVKIGRPGRMSDHHFLAVFGNVLNRKPDRRHRHIHDDVDLFGVVPAARKACADVGLELVVP